MTELLDDQAVDVGAIAAEDDSRDDSPRRRGRRWGDKGLDDDTQAVFDAQPMVARCGLCDWTFEGLAGEARAAQFEHRATHARHNGSPKPGKPVRHESQGLTADERREAVAKVTAPKRWTREQLIERLQEWARTHGGPPTSSQWQKNPASGPWPATFHVTGEFGRWSTAIVEAGLNRVPSGRAEPVSPAAQDNPVVAPDPEPRPDERDDGPRGEVAKQEELSLVELAREADECREILDDARRDYQAALARLAVAVSEAAAA